MERLKAFLQYVDYQPAFNLGIAVAALAIAIIVTVLLMHTLYVLGRHSPLYRSKKPAKGWDKRFYPASSGMIVALLILVWLLEVWRHQYATP